METRSPGNDEILGETGEGSQHEVDEKFDGEEDWLMEGWELNWFVGGESGR